MDLRPSWAKVIQPSTCHTRGVLSFSLSSGCDSGSAFIPLPSIQRLRQRFTGIPLQNHHRAFALWINGTCCKYYTLQHPSQAAPSHLPITHCWAHAICKDVGWGSLAHGNAPSGEKTQEKNVTITVLLFIYKQVRVYFFQGEQPDKEKTVHDDAFHIKYSWLKKKHNQKMCCVVFHYLVSLSREIKRRRRSIKGQMSQSSGSSKTFLRVDRSFKISSRKSAYKLFITATTFWQKELQRYWDLQPSFKLQPHWINWYFSARVSFFSFQQKSDRQRNFFLFLSFLKKIIFLRKKKMKMIHYLKSKMWFWQKV